MFENILLIVIVLLAAVIVGSSLYKVMGKSKKMVQDSSSNPQQEQQLEHFSTSQDSTPMPIEENRDKGVMNLFNNVCSPACCKFENLWRTPLADDPIQQVPDFVPNEYTCSNATGTGCMCMSPDQAKFLITRAGNA